MMGPVVRFPPPKDYPEGDDVDNEWDPTGYYARKTAHREEMLPYLAAMFAAAIACAFVAWAWSMVG